MQAGTTSLLDVVQSIGPYITDDDLIRQAKGSCCHVELKGHRD